MRNVHNTNLPPFALPRFDFPLSSDNSVANFHGFSIDRLHQKKKKKQRSDIKLFWTEGVRDSATFRRLSVYYNDKPVSQKKVYEWVENSITIVDDARSGQLSSATYVEFKKQSSQLVGDNQTINNDKIVFEISISK